MLIQCLAITICAFHCLNESLPVNKGQQSNSHPCKTLTIYINVEVGRVEVDDFRGWVRQQVPVTQRQSVGTLLREDTQELLKGRCWGAQLEIYLDGFAACNQVSREGRIVKGVEPGPADTPVVIVGVDPLESFEVDLADVGEEILHVILVDVELLLVVSDLPAIFAHLHVVHILIHLTLALLIEQSLYDVLHPLGSQLVKLIFIDLSSLGSLQF